MLGPWSETMTISTSAGSPVRPSSASRTAVVTSIVFASASLTMDTPTLGLPFVREMLFGAAAPRLTPATSAEKDRARLRHPHHETLQVVDGAKGVRRLGKDGLPALEDCSRRQTDVVVSQGV